MKTDKYKDWETNFFEGETLTPEELEILQSESDNPYFSVIKSEQSDKLNVSFDDFMTQVAEDNSVSDLPIARKESKRSFSVQVKEYWAAASLVLFMGLTGGYFFVNQNDGQIKDRPIIANAKPTEKNNPTVTDVIEITKPQTKEVVAKSTAKIVEEINHPETTYAEDAVDEQLAQTTMQANLDDNEYQENYVIINGRPVYNEQEAIALTEDAINYLASNVNKTVSHVENVKSLNLDF